MSLISELKANQPENCQRLERFILRNNDTGEIIPAKCKCYKCAFCGWRKALSLQKALENHFRTYVHVRLFTFTFRNSEYENLQSNPKEQLKIIRKCNEVWRRFINNIRRMPDSAKYMREFQYVKVLEFTKKGYPHFHVIVDRFLDIRVMTRLWRSAVNQVFGTIGINGGINVRHSMNAKGASKYIAKYVLKSSIDLANQREKYRLWSRSGNIAIFEVREKTGTWVFVENPDALLNLNKYRITSRSSAQNAESS